MRRVTKRMRKHVSAEVDPLVKVFLITMTHEDLTEPIRVSSDPTVKVGEEANNVIYGTISNGETYYYAGFEASLCSDQDSVAPKVQISIPNCSRPIIEAIESIGVGSVNVNLKLVFADTPDVIETEIPDMEMAEIEYDESTITGTLSRDLLFSEPFPFRSFTPIEFPYLFQSKVTGQ